MISNLTGHRLQDLPCSFEYKHPWKIEKIKLFQKYLEENPPEYLISGMAIGFDMWGAWAAVKVGVPLHAYVPFVGQEKLWKPHLQKQYHDLLDKAEKVVIVCDGQYAAYKMQVRNVAMLKAADQVLALWNPEKTYGGTHSTVMAALSMAKPVINFWPEIPTEIVKGKITCDT